MAEPTKKHPEMGKVIDAFNPSGRRRVDSIKADICSWCGQPATEFKDKLSCKEYTISGFCQSCQDKAFAKPELGDEFDEPDVEVIALQRPTWGYCVMKCLRELNNPKYSHLPQFSTAEGHGVGNPVTLRTGTGEEICQLDWDTFKHVYVID